MLQEFKTHPLMHEMLDGGERIAWGAKTITGAASGCQPLHAPGPLLVGDSAGLVDVLGLKGVHYAIDSGGLAAESAFAERSGKATSGRPGALDPTSMISSGYLWKEMREARNMRPAFDRRVLLRRHDRERGDRHEGERRARGSRRTRTPEESVIRTAPAAGYTAPDGALVFDKLSSVFASGNATRDDQPNHVRIERSVPARCSRAGSWMCPAQVYEIEEDARDGSSREADARRTASSAARSPPRAGASPRPRAVGPRVPAHLGAWRDVPPGAVGGAPMTTPTGDRAADIAVVGAGIVGLATARALAAAPSGAPPRWC